MSIPLCTWPPAPPRPVLTAEAAHVWCVSLEQTSPLDIALLSDDELARAQRFRFEPDRRKFVTARAALRRILGRYLGLDPRAVGFAYGAYGKPELPAAPQLCFNLSHSGELGLLAVTLNRKIGVDLEHVHPVEDVAQLARQFFSARERAGLLAVPRERQQEIFFNLWTRKEAFIKACGEGLSYPLDQFAVTWESDVPVQLLEARTGPAELASWSLQALDPAPGYVAALAVEGHSAQLTCWRAVEGESVP